MEKGVGRRIRVWRVVRDLSQDQLAAAAGVTRNFVSASSATPRGSMRSGCAGSRP